MLAPSLLVLLEDWVAPVGVMLGFLLSIQVAHAEHPVIPLVAEVCHLLPSSWDPEAACPVFAHQTALLGLGLQEATVGTMKGSSVAMKKS